MERRKRSPSESSYSSCLSSASLHSYYGLDSSSTDVELLNGPGRLNNEGLQTRTLLDDVKAILRKHDKKLSQMEDNVTTMVRWLNDKFGFILKCESASSLSGSEDAVDAIGSLAGSPPSSSEEPVAGTLAELVKPNTSFESQSRDDQTCHGAGEEGYSLQTAAEVTSEPTGLLRTLDKVHLPIDQNRTVLMKPPNLPSCSTLSLAHTKNASSVVPKLSANNKLRSTKRTKSFHSGKIEGPPQCDICGKFLKDPGTLRQHKQIHLNIRPFTCSHPDCGKSFRRKFHLQTHSLIHQGIKKHQCGYCGRLFLLQKDLVSHERIHTGERPFQCTECSKSFNLKSHLVMHLRTHTGEKPYKCDICSKCFTQSNSLRLHKKKVHQDSTNLSAKRNNGVVRSKKSKTMKPASLPKSSDSTTVETSPGKVPIYRYRGALVAPSSSMSTTLLLPQPMFATQSYELADISVPNDQLIFPSPSVPSVVEQEPLHFADPHNLPVFGHEDV